MTRLILPHMVRPRSRRRPALPMPHASRRPPALPPPPQEKRRKGAVINVSSAAGVLPCGAGQRPQRPRGPHPLTPPPAGDPLYAVYSASKAYIDYLSRSLHAELRARGVFVQCQVPYFVTTKLSKLRRASLLIPDPATYARAAVSWIGAPQPRHNPSSRPSRPAPAPAQAAAARRWCRTAPTQCSTG